MWIVQLGLHFGSDLLNAYLVVKANGYNTVLMPKFWDLALFYTTRPRLAWIVLTALGYWPYWRSLAKQTLIVEGLMQMIGCYYFGRTAQFANKHGFYTHSHYDHYAQLMYAGALLTLITTFFAVIGLLFSLASLSDDEQDPKTDGSCVIFFLAAIVISFGLGAFAGRWCFQISFVALAGDSYCLPDLTVQAVIWVLMHLL